MKLNFFWRDWPRLVSVVFLSLAVWLYFTIEGCSTAPLLSFLTFFGLMLVWVCDVLTAKTEGANSIRKGKRREFDWATHYFRGYAIACIVISHWLGLFGYMKIKMAVFYSSTIFFLFISGYLCQYIYDRKPNAACQYYSKKLTNVIAPFAVCSALTVIGVCCVGVSRPAVVDPMRLGVGKTILKCIAGGAQAQYWYIPFVSVLFLISPWLCRLQHSTIVAVFIGTFVASIAIPARQGLIVFDWPKTLYLYTYFSCYYVLGFVYCRFKDVFDDFIRRFWWMFLAGAICFALALYFPGFLGVHYVEEPLLVSLQRVCSMAVVLFALNFVKSRRIVVLDLLATYSFTIYFLHYFFISDFVTWAGEVTVGKMLGLLVAFFVLLLVVSVAAKKAFGRWSRMFIGS